MKKLLVIITAILFINTLAKAQDYLEQQHGVYNKQWVDSVNTLSLLKINNIAPVMIDWYVYEGQTTPLPQPSNILNIIRVKLKNPTAEKAK